MVRVTPRVSRRKAAVPYAGLTSGGPPKDIVHANQIIWFPARLLKGGAKYYAVQVSGTSMTGAGIHDGDYVLIQKTETPEHGAIMLVRHEDQSLVKRVRIKGNRVYLCWEDRSGRKMEVNSSGYEVQGKFIRVVRPPANGPHDIFCPVTA
jgi:SOS-response transcriptional repressor LexA